MGSQVIGRDPDWGYTLMMAGRASIGIYHPFLMCHSRSSLESCLELKAGIGERPSLQPQFATEGSIPLGPYFARAWMGQVSSICSR